MSAARLHAAFHLACFATSSHALHGPHQDPFLAKKVMSLPPSTGPTEKPPEAAFRAKLGSDALEGGQNLTWVYGCQDYDQLKDADGNPNPFVDWENEPVDTETLILMIDDIDSVNPDNGQKFPHIHWLMTNIPRGYYRVLRDCTRSHSNPLPPGAVELVNSFGLMGFSRPCSPPFAKHRFRVRLYARADKNTRLNYNWQTDSANDVNRQLINDEDTLGWAKINFAYTRPDKSAVRSKGQPRDGTVEDEDEIRSSGEKPSNSPRGAQLRNQLNPGPAAYRDNNGNRNNGGSNGAAGKSSYQEAKEFLPPAQQQGADDVVNQGRAIGNMASLVPGVVEHKYKSALGETLASEGLAEGKMG